MDVGAAPYVKPQRLSLGALEDFFDNVVQISKEADRSVDHQWMQECGLFEAAHANQARRVREQEEAGRAIAEEVDRVRSLDKRAAPRAQRPQLEALTAVRSRSRSHASSSGESGALTEWAASLRASST